MWRRLLNLLAALSLVLSVAVCVLWARTRGQNVLVVQLDGALCRFLLSDNGYLAYAVQSGRAFATQPTATRQEKFVGLGFREQRFPGGDFIREVYVPHWWLVIVTGALPALWAARRVARRSVAAGLCRSCGYDLRVTPGRCPECGASPTAAPEPN